MRPVYQPRAAIAQRCGHRNLTLSAEPPQEYCPQSVGGLFHVKRIALHPAYSFEKSDVSIQHTQLHPT